MTDVERVELLNKSVIDFEKELSQLYNYQDDGSLQFTKWQMLVAIQHGYRLARTALDTPGAGGRND